MKQRHKVHQRRKSNHCAICSHASVPQTEEISTRFCTTHTKPHHEKGANRTWSSCEEPSDRISAMGYAHCLGTPCSTSIRSLVPHFARSGSTRYGNAFSRINQIISSECVLAWAGIGIECSEWTHIFDGPRLTLVFEQGNLSTELWVASTVDWTLASA